MRILNFQWRLEAYDMADVFQILTFDPIVYDQPVMSSISLITPLD